MNALSLERLRPVLFGLFFVSGFCGLLYQVVWLRMAFASFGVITPVLSVVVSVFMLGLALGNWVAGRWVTRWSRSTGLSPIAFYGMAEAGIGVGAFSVPELFDAGSALLLPLGEFGSAGYLALSGMILTLSILPWCFFMGTTFPLVTAYLREQGEAGAASFSFLYLANVMGATLGVLSTALVLIEWLGFAATLRLAGISNFLIAGGGLWLARASAASAVSMPTTQGRAVSTGGIGAEHRGWVYGLLFATGFASMAMEVVWIRAFTPMLSTTIYAFASLLATYLVATWIGTTAYRRALERGRPFETTEMLLALCFSAGLPVLMIDPRWPTGAVGPLLSIAPLCAVLGALTPKLIDDYAAGDPEALGRSYGVNIVGSIVGPLCAAYLLLPSMELKWILVLLSVPFFGFALWQVRREAGGRRGAGLVAIAGAVLAVAAVRSTSFEDPRFHRVAEVRRDHTATVVAVGEDRRRMLLVNGVGLTHMTPITKIMAHLPMAHLDHPPRQTLVLCFGMGTTVRSAASWGGEVTAVELVPSVVESFPFYFDDADEILASPRVEVVIDDARRFLRRGTRKFDVVTIDPPPPVEAAGSSLLYSQEFYELLKQRMSEDAILQQWFPIGEHYALEAVARSLVQSFPYVRMLSSLETWGYHFLASMSPLPVLTGPELFARMPLAARDDLAEWIDPEELENAMVRSVRTEHSLDELLEGSGDHYVSDDRPVNEYYMVRRLLNPEPSQP